MPAKMMRGCSAAVAMAAIVATACTSEPEGRLIAWTDGLGSLGNTQPAQNHRLQCPPNGKPGTAYGHDVYTADSSICTAAAHVGAITAERGGSFTLQVLPEQRFFGASIRNNVSTTAYGRYGSAFAISRDGSFPAPEPSAAVPITWETTGLIVNVKDREPYPVSCPPGGRLATVYGHDAYTSDSSICTAALHAGAVSLDRGGDVSIFSAAGRTVYGSSSRNGVSTNAYGTYSTSFTIGNATPVSESEIPLRWQSSGMVLPAGKRMTVQCPPAGDTATVYGTDVYTADSSVCAAAVHVGVIDRERGGAVQVERGGPQESFVASERNGISTSGYGRYGSSFRIVK